MRPLSPVPRRPLPHLPLCDYFSIFFGPHDLPSNLAESRYPHPSMVTEGSFCGNERAKRQYFLNLVEPLVVVL